MLTKKDVYGIVITYNPDKSVIYNINQLLKQVDSVLIIDNCSKNENKMYLNIFEINARVKLIHNEKNMGIAYALNQGLSQARLKNYKLFLTLDQDSRLQNNYVEEMLKVLNMNKNLVSLGANYQNKNFIDKYHEVDVLITSGNLTYTDFAISSGGYNNDLFIDSVDFDFSLRLQKNNGKIAIVKNAKMDHKLGEQRVIKFIKIRFYITIHSPIRHYYMFRNHHFIINTYFKHFPKFCFKKEVMMWKYFFEVLLFHKRKKENLCMIFKGISHGIRKEYGSYVK